MPFFTRIMQSPRFLACVMGGFLISVMASPSFPFVNGPLAVLLIITVTFCLLSISMGYYDDESIEIRNKQGTSCYKKAEYLLIFAPSFALSILLLIRLFSRNKFFTVPGLLEFGPKNGDMNEFISNIAFLGGSGTAFGHWIQGFLASFLLRVNCKKCKKNDVDDLSFHDSDGNADDQRMAWRCGRTPPGMNIANIAAYYGTIYPTYNFVKRCIRTPDTFATSSYMNNGMEWALGFWTGHAAGFIADTMFYNRMRPIANASGSDSTAETVVSIISEEETRPSSAITTTTADVPVPEPTIRSEDKRWNCPFSFSFVLLMLGWVIGTLFLTSVFGACIMTGYTWNKCEGESEECVNYNPDEFPAIIAFIITMVPTLTVCAVLC
ncbi:unnamed protein product [Pseudo-nitzschia multistriata]|uniref:Uncharacterized protein n=1 Tax=Pseudo-nitzschia multistriata TaxID=183589 RepID=A0A448Z922_9STRA|nr:unnamed protein product [Pseudo-nitzschia multistriata]